MDEHESGQQEKKKGKGKDPFEDLIESYSDDGEDNVVCARGKKKKRKKWRREEEENVMLRDPFMVLGFDILVMVLRRLDARSLAQSLIVSRSWHGVASSDRLWSTKCEELWLDKAHIPRSSLVWGLPKLAAYSISVMDGRREAPEYWRNLDPYWKGTGPPMRLYFHLDGTQSADPGDEVWGGHESSYSIVTSFEGQDTIRDHYVRINRWPRMSVKKAGLELENVEQVIHLLQHS